MIENSELVEIIHRAPLFMALDDDSASALRKSMDEVRLTRGQTLFSEGDQAERLYVIGEGKIKLGTIYLNRGNYHESLNIFENSLNICDHSFGKDSK